MKNILCCILICVCCLTVSAPAQDDPGKLTYGFFGGVNAANVSGHAESTDGRTGYALGGVINYSSGGVVSYQIELLFNGKGYVIEDATLFDTETEEFGGVVEAQWILSYLEMPILAKFTLPTGKKYRPYLLGGGFMSLLIRDKLRLSDSAFVYDFDIDDTKKADAGLILGIGIDLKAGENGWLFFESRYELSLIAAIKNEDQKSRVLGFRVGYWF